MDGMDKILERISRKGRKFYGCERYPECDFVSWDRPVNDKCPVCGSRNLTKIDRMNGYLSYSRVKGDTRLNDAKMAEIAERRSM